MYMFVVISCREQHLVQWMTRRGPNASVASVARPSRASSSVKIMNKVASGSALTQRKERPTWGGVLLSAAKCSVSMFLGYDRGFRIGFLRSVVILWIYRCICLCVFVLPIRISTSCGASFRSLLCRIILIPLFSFWYVPGSPIVDFGCMPRAAATTLRCFDHYVCACISFSCSCVYYYY